MRLPFVAACLCLLVTPALFGQPGMPAWLAPYPGAAPQTKSYSSMVEATYTVEAAPDAVTDHYRKLFEAQGLPFLPNSDGAGGSVLRGAAAECNLMIAIRAQGSGAGVRVSCTAKNASSGAASLSGSGVSSARTASLSGVSRQPPPGMPASLYERHLQLAEEMGIGKERPDADAPPLVWPDWLVHVNGARLSPRAGVDQSGNSFLRCRYVTSAPMTQIFAFYKDQLTAHEYPLHRGLLTTGQTQKGVQQNALGEIEGTNYPEDFPGPRTEIRVTMDRMHLNDPITVDLRFTTFAYKAPKSARPPQE